MQSGADRGSGWLSISTFPDKLRLRAAGLIASSADLVTTAHIRINALGSQVFSLTPGSWEDITLAAGWTNLAGYTPALVRIAGLGSVQVTGHITGGTTTAGTVIGTVGAGFYNPAYSHQFTGNVLSGASAVNVAGTVSGAVSETPVNYNTCTITLNTSGQLVLENCPAPATQVSFNETLPLIGA